MSETRRTTSTAARINRSFTLRMAVILFWVDLFILVLTVISWCYIQEKIAFAGNWQPSLSRSLTIASDLPWYRWPETCRIQIS